MQEARTRDENLPRRTACGRQDVQQRIPALFRESEIECEEKGAQRAARWKEPTSAIRKACARFKKPAIITELSAFSFDGAASIAWQAHGKLLTDYPVDFQEQADQIEAAMRALTPLECVRGVSWNFWDAYEPGLFRPWAGGDQRNDLFQGKPAEKVLEWWYSKKNINQPGEPVFTQQVTRQ